MANRLLELFCGTKSVGKVFENAGYEVVSLDYDSQFNATHIEDILIWDYTQYPRDYFNVIWASPDCTTWSIATSGKYRLKTEIYGRNNESQEKATLGNNMVLRVIEILKYFNAKWFIENPKGLLIHFPPLKDFIKEVNGYNTLVYYANYNNWGFPKPTHIWASVPLWERENCPVMSEDTYTTYIRKYDGRIQRSYKTYNTKAENRSKIPSDLVQRLLNIVSNGV